MRSLRPLDWRVNVYRGTRMSSGDRRQDQASKRTVEQDVQIALAQKLAKLPLKQLELVKAGLASVRQALPRGDAQRTAVVTIDELCALGWTGDRATTPRAG